MCNMRLVRLASTSLIVRQVLELRLHHAASRHGGHGLVTPGPAHHVSHVSTVRSHGGGWHPVTREGRVAARDDGEDLTLARVLWRLVVRAAVHLLDARRGCRGAGLGPVLGRSGRRM
jgi:hypothetical protein